MRQPTNHVEAFFALLVPFALVLIVLVFFHRKHLLWQQEQGIVQDCPGCDEMLAQRQQEPTLSSRLSYWNGLSVDQIRSGGL